MESVIYKKELTKEQIINLWRIGYSLSCLCKEYKRNCKNRGIYITLFNAQKIIEPIIFEYQTNLMRK